MAKQHKKPQPVDTENVVDELNVTQSSQVERTDLQQGGELEKDSAKFVETPSQEVGNDSKSKKEPAQTVEPAVVKSSNTRDKSLQADNRTEQKSGVSKLAVLALLVALAVGATGHFFGSTKFAQLEQRISALQTNTEQLAKLSETPTSQNLPNFDAEKVQLAQLEQATAQTAQQAAHLQQQQDQLTKEIKSQISSLHAQLQQLGTVPKVDTSVLLLSDADFLLTNALRKMVIDNDIDTAKSLLLAADNALSQVNDPQISTVREAIKTDLNLLASLNQVDQNNVMQRLAQLANLVDDMPMLESEQFSLTDDGEVSDSLADWQQNIEKSANSFLNRFIRVSDKNKVQDKAFIAPNQEIYLRENIRLRLQIAILAVPRQQHELYKQSLEAVSTWVRSYFDVKNESVESFLKEADELIEQSIYIDAPNTLQSLDLLKQKLNRRPQPVEKIQLEVDKATDALKIEKVNAEQPSEVPATEQQ